MIRFVSNLPPYEICTNLVLRGRYTYHHMLLSPLDIQVLGSGDEEDVAALSMALDLGSLCEDVQIAVSSWRANVPLAPEEEAEEVKGNAAGSLQGGEDLSGRGPLIGGSGSRPSRSVRGGRSGGCTAAAKDVQAGGSGGSELAGSSAQLSDSTQQARRESDFLKAIRPFQFREMPISQGHFFR